MKPACRIVIGKSVSIPPFTFLAVTSAFASSGSSSVMPPFTVEKSSDPLTPIEPSRARTEPFTVVAGPGLKAVVLTQNAGLKEFLDGSAGLTERLEADGAFQDGVWRLVKRGALTYQGGRVVYDCLAIKLQGGSASPPK